MLSRVRNGRSSEDTSSASVANSPSRETKFEFFFLEGAPEGYSRQSASTGMLVVNKRASVPYTLLSPRTSFQTYWGNTDCQIHCMYIAIRSFLTVSIAARNPTTLDRVKKRRKFVCMFASYRRNFGRLHVTKIL